MIRGGFCPGIQRGARSERDQAGDPPVDAQDRRDPASRRSIRHPNVGVYLPARERSHGDAHFSDIANFADVTLVADFAETIPAERLRDESLP